MSYFVGVDVGTGSVRAGLVDQTGRVLKTHSKEITVHNPRPNFYQQSSSEIWSFSVDCIKNVVAGIEPATIKGIGFDATCSLVVIGPEQKGLCIDPNGESKWDIVMWMDHRAMKETDFVNGIQDPAAEEVRRFVGGKISVEMQVPKLLWLKKNMPDTFNKAKYFFDLSDFLTWKASGSLSRSLCSTVCKWTYLATLDGGIKGWNKEFFELANLSELIEDNFEKLGSKVVSPGTSCGTLSPVVASELGLSPDTVVATSLIDAHAGVLGLLACTPARKLTDVHGQLSLVAGTSSCHMFLSPKPALVHGVWGPYFSAILDKFWLLEGGQTAVGKLLDHVIETHPAYAKAKSEAATRGMAIQQYLEVVLEEMKESQGLQNVAFLTKDLHVYPDFHGNRSPLADPNMKGMISGLTLDSGVNSLGLLYLATLQAVSYGTRHIIDEVESKSGNPVKVITVCGGLSKSAIFVQTQADVTGNIVVLPEEKESVLLGSAISGAAAYYKQDLKDVISQMMCDGKEFKPDTTLKAFHDAKYRVFRAMGEDQLKYKNLMTNNLK